VAGATSCPPRFRLHRIVGIEINNSIVDVTSRRMQYYSGFDKIPNF